MAHEEGIVKELSERFPFLQDKFRTQRERRLYVEVPLERFRAVFENVVRMMGFSHLCILTGTDEGEQFGFMYHLARPDGTMLNMKTYAPRSHPVIKTVADLFPASWPYERELVDLLGVQVEGLPKGQNRYPLPDDWPPGQYPLRKDWKPEMLAKAQAEAAARTKAQASTKKHGGKRR